MICEFLEDAYPCYFPKLLPEDPYDKAFARIWIDFVGKAFLPSFFRLLQSQEKEKQDEARADLYKAIEQITAKRKGPYFFGQEFSLVDIAIAPWAIRDYILSEHRGYKREDLGKSWVDWVGALESRPSVTKTTSVGQSSRLLLYSAYLRLSEQGTLR